MGNSYHENTEETEHKQEPKKIGIIDRFVMAMFLPSEYGKLIKLKTGKLIVYLIWLILLATVIQYAIPMFGAIAGLGGIRGIVINEIPEFSFQDGTFYFGERFEQTDENVGMYVLIDTSVERFTSDDIPENMMQAILVSSTNMLVYNNVTGWSGIVQDETFDYYKEFAFNNESVARQAPVIYTVIFILFIGIYIVVFIKYLFMALFYAVFAYLLTKMMMMDTTFGKIYKIALYAQSIGTIVAAVAYCLDISLVVMAGNIFNVFVTIAIINRALMKMQEDSLEL